MQRRAWAQPWYCKHCWSPSGKDKWWNRADCEKCTKCGQHKSTAFAGHKQPLVPSKSVSQNVATPSGAATTKLEKELKRCKDALAQLRSSAGRGQDRMEVDEGPVDPSLQGGMEGSLRKQLADTSAHIEAFKDIDDPDVVATLAKLRTK